MTSHAPKLAFALDLPTLGEARAHAQRVGNVVDVFKVGLELFVKEGPTAVRELSNLGAELFLDLKLHDIPKTVERATGSATSLGVDYLTLHAGGAAAMIEGARRRVDADGATLKLLAITVLTSLDAQDLHALGIDCSPAEHTLRLAKLAVNAGAHGLVCSTREVGTLRKALGPDVILVTPGIRPSGGDSGDQKRTGTPAQAALDGSSMLVVGRPIRDAHDPRAAAESIRRQATGKPE